MKARVWAWFGAVFSAVVLTASAQPTILSVTPTNGATGVTNTAKVVFTFSTAMDTNTVVAYFDSVGSQLPTFSTWTGNTRVAFTRSPPWPNDAIIHWVIGGRDTNGNSLAGPLLSGTFRTATTTFMVGKVYLFDQTSTNVATSDPTAPYGFSATTMLAPDRTPSVVNLTLPTSTNTNLAQAFGQPELFNLFTGSTNPFFIDTTYPTGTYTFVLQPSNSLMVQVDLPSTLVQPITPHISNYNSTQSVNATNSFQLMWDPFAGGTVTDTVIVVVGTNFQTANPDRTNRLNGTATSVMIPANTLAANSNYSATVGFYRAVTISNTANNYGTVAYLASQTQFTLLTGSGTASNSIVLTNWAVTNGLFSFDVKTGPSLTVRVDYNSDLGTTNWTTLIMTNSGNGVVRVTDPQIAAFRARYYRAHLGP